MKPAFRATLRVAQGGRIVIPAAVRDQLGLQVGSDLVMTVEDDRATLTSAAAARHRARQRVRRCISHGASLVDELLAERKREAQRE